MVESMVAMVLADQLLQVIKGAESGAMHYLAAVLVQGGLPSSCTRQTDKRSAVCFLAHLQHYAQCELLPRDDEIADKTLTGQFAGAVSHQ